jgi:hypothetical protein
MMKWFKASRGFRSLVLEMSEGCNADDMGRSDVLKFHYFTQQLFDSNCLLLVLKMFGLSDVYAQVQSKNEWEDWK